MALHGGIAAPAYRHGRSRRASSRVFTLLVLATLASSALVAATLAPTTARSTEPVFPVMNTDEEPPDGVWFRNSPSQGDTNRETGFGVYRGESVQVTCYSWGDAVGQYGNQIWYLGTNVTRPTINGHANRGYMNTHYVNDGQIANNPHPSVPQCGASPPQTSSGGVTLAQGSPAPSGYYYSIQLSGFPAGATVNVTCADSVDPGGYLTITLSTDGAGNASSQRNCYSGDGPDHWVVAGDAESNHVTWSDSGSPHSGDPGGTDDPGTGDLGEHTEEVEKPDITDPCMAAWPNGTVSSRSIFGGTEENHDRTQSLYQVCSGFGMGTPQGASNGMKCAVASAIVDLAGPPKAAAALTKACLWVGVAENVSNGDWATAVGSVGCAFFSDLVATGSGVLAAGATAATGPGAVAIGVNVYKGLSVGLGLACSGIFDGGAFNFGYNNETRHLANVALDVARYGKCIRMTTVFGYIRWSAADCP